MIRKISILSASFAIVACGGSDSSNVTINQVIPSDADADASRIVFQPADGLLAVPNDLLFSGSVDGTLEAPAEVEAKDAGLAVNFADPAQALGALDGWSTQMPLQLNLDMVDGVTIDPDTVGPETVVMIEANMGGDAGCEAVPRGAACSPVAQLAYGIDYVAVVGASGDTLAVVPITPLAPSTTYLVGLTSGLLDSNGDQILGSELYEELTRSDIAIQNSTLGGLQGVINSYEGVLAAGASLDPDSMIYTSAWTTTSVGAAMEAVVGLAAQAPPSITEVVFTGITVEQALIGAGALPGAAEGTTNYQNALLYSGKITLPYYSATIDENPSGPLTDAWTARCDSGATLLARADEIPEEVPEEREQNNAFCELFGLNDYGLDTERHITQFNPIPEKRADMELDVQITVPDSGSNWPMVIMQHGITSQKEDMLALTGALTAAGFATFAIDHPLHGSRGFDTDPETDGQEINASTGSATNYMNLERLLVTRDNLRQSSVDMVGLRMALETGISGDLNSDDFDQTEVHLVGMSLGGITGVAYAALSNGAGFENTSTAYSAPGGGVAAFLLESGSFGPLIQASVLIGSDSELSAEFASSLQSPDASCAALALTNQEAFLVCQFQVFTSGLDAVGLAEIAATVNQFAFAAQTIVDTADPNNFAAVVAGLGLPTYVAEISGDGVNNLSDQTIPNQTEGVLFGGTEPLAAYLGLSGVDASNSPQAQGIVRFSEGAHGTLLDPTSSAAATEDMQTQIATFLASGQIFVLADDLVLPAP